jgi:hypothetical protein
MTNPVTDDGSNGFLSGIVPEVNLIGKDGNAFGILGSCQKAARQAGVPQEEIKLFMDLAMNGNYDHLLSTVMIYFAVN